MIAKFAKILRVTGVKTGVGVLIFDVNRSRIGVGFRNFGAGLESESQKSDSGHLWHKVQIFVLVVGLYGVCIVTPLRVGWQSFSNVVPCAFY